MSTHGTRFRNQARRASPIPGHGVRMNLSSDANVRLESCTMDKPSGSVTAGTIIEIQVTTEWFNQTSGLNSVNYNVLANGEVIASGSLGFGPHDTRTDTVSGTTAFESAGTVDVEIEVDGRSEVCDSFDVSSSTDDTTNGGGGGDTTNGGGGDTTNGGGGDTTNGGGGGGGGGGLIGGDGDGTTSGISSSTLLLGGLAIIALIALRGAIGSGGGRRRSRRQAR